MTENRYGQAQDTVLPPPSLGNAPGRMKAWDECGIEEKVERLRAELVGVRYAIRSSHDTCQRLRHHSHDPLGHVVVPLVDDNLATGTGFDWLA